MHKKWSILLKQYYQALEESRLIEAITPKLLQEYESFMTQNSLFGMTVMDVNKISTTILQVLAQRYEKTEKKQTFNQFIKQELIADGMVETLQFLESFQK